MQTSPYLDIHTHGRTREPGTMRVASLSMDEMTSGELPEGFTSGGIHPWWLEDYTTQEIEATKTKVEVLAQGNQLWAIGETGIDRAYPEFLEAQFDLFRWHLKLADAHGLPLIIHNVRSGSDFLGIIKDEKPTTPWIFHDFRGNEELMRKLMALHPQCYFSFGLSLDNSPQVRELLPLIPLDKLFLETDNQKHLDIHDIYLRAAEQLKLDLDFLKSQIWLNFRKVAQI